jgi:hypothetical protein
MRLSFRSKLNAGLQITIFLLSTVLSVPVYAYEYPLSPEVIREAYFLGTRQGGLGAALLGQYARSIPELKQGTCTSEARIETPFLQVVDYASKAVNYSAQDAVKDFHDKPAVFRMYLNICYAVKAPPANSVTIRVLQDKKVFFPVSDKRAPYAEAADEGSYLPSNGEKIQLECVPGKLNSTTLTIEIDTPDGQHAETTFDLQTLR